MIQYYSKLIKFGHGFGILLSLFSIQTVLANNLGLAQAKIAIPAISTRELSSPIASTIKSYYNDTVSKLDSSYASPENSSTLAKIAYENNTDNTPSLNNPEASISLNLEDDDNNSNSLVKNILNKGVLFASNSEFISDTASPIIKAKRDKIVTSTAAPNPGQKEFLELHLVLLRF